MYGLASLALGVVLGIYSADVPTDVQVVPTRQFLLPLEVDPARKDAIKQIRFLVSENKGKSWRYKSDHQPEEPYVSFLTERDGQFWFALQIEFKDGRVEPATLTELTGCRKCFINTKLPASTVKAWKPHDPLTREVEELKKTVEQLQKRVRELEAAQKTARH